MSTTNTEAAPPPHPSTMPTRSLFAVRHAALGPRDKARLRMGEAIADHINDVQHTGKGLMQRCCREGAMFGDDKSKLKWNDYDERMARCRHMWVGDSDTSWLGGCSEDGMGMLDGIRYYHECWRCGLRLKCGGVGHGYFRALGDYYAHPYLASGYIIGKAERHNPKPKFRNMVIRGMPELDERKRLGRYLWHRVRAWLRRRAIAFCWMEATAKALYAEGGAGRRRDRLTFRGDFVCGECEEGGEEDFRWCAVRAPAAYDAAFPALG